MNPFYILYVLREAKNDCHLQLDNEGDEVFYQIENMNFSDNNIERIASSYLKCMKNKKMLIIPLIVGGFHQNMLIFNFHRNEVERFEPHGKVTSAGYLSNSKELDKNIKEKLIDEINKKIPEQNKLSFVPATDVCPAGFQNYQGYESQAIKKTKKNDDVIIEDSKRFICVALVLLLCFDAVKISKTSSGKTY